MTDIEEVEVKQYPPIDVQIALIEQEQERLTEQALTDPVS